MMRHHVTAFAFAVLACGTVAADDYKLESLDKAPAGLSDKVAPVIAPAGHRIAGPKGPYVEVWLAKQLATKDDFRPTLNVKYPFANGQLIGALRVPEGADFKDFRGQQVKPGAYTLRYGKQPEDGNHIGTSDLYDFLLALPAAADADPAVIESFETLAQSSAKSAGAAHPAILSLLPPEGDAKAPALTHLADREFQVLTLSGKTAGDKPLPLRVVVVGQSEI